MDSHVQQIKDRLSINEVVGGYVQLKRAGRNYSAKCPFHKEKTASFYVSPERGTYMCFGCGEKGDIFSFIQKVDGIDFKTALELLAQRAGVKLERQFIQKPENKEKEERLRDVCEEAVKFFEQTLRGRTDVEEYLKNRGVREETTLAWRIGYAPAAWELLSKHLITLGFSKDDIVEAGFAVKSEKKLGEIFDRFRGRIIFPIFDSAGKPIAVSGRFFEKVPGQKEDTEPAKYINSPETVLFKKSRVLYGYDRAKSFIRKADCILLVEGQFDLTLAHQSGLPFAVALSGTALTQEHLSLLGRLSKRLVLALDADQAGLRSGIKSAGMAYAAGFDVKVPTFPAGKDPADVAKENPELLKAAIRTSKTAIEFFLDALRRALPAGRQGDERAYKKTVEAQILPLLAALPSKIEQEHFIRIVASSLHVSEEAVRAEVAKRPPLADTTEEVFVSGEVSPGREEQTTPLDKKAGMLLFYFGKESAVGARLLELLGKEGLGRLEEMLGTQAERLRFRFERELGGHTTETAIAEDMLNDIERSVAKERFKMKFL